MKPEKRDQRLRNLFEALSEHDSDCSKRWWFGEDGQRHCDCGAYEFRENFLEPFLRANDEGAK